MERKPFREDVLVEQKRAMRREGKGKGEKLDYITTEEDLAGA
jgi:hypothetical protein